MHRGRWRTGIVAWTVVALGAWAAPAAPAVAPEFHLNASVRSNLATIQQSWSEWLAAYDLGDTESSEQALESLFEAMGQLSMTALPELSLGASTLAVESARLGDLRRAEGAIEVAERLDPTRPETAFARAAIHRLEGDWWNFAVDTGLGYIRALRLPVERRIWLHNLLLWFVTTLSVTGCAFAAILMLVRGPALFGSLLQALRRVVPVPIGIVVILALLLWPMALSAGVIAVALNWSVLLWAYCQRSERWVLVCLVLLFGIGPVVLDEERRRVAVELAPMAATTEDVRLGRLRGTTFTSLQRLATVLPDSAAVLHLTADVHRRIGQCEEAVPLYQHLLETEERNAAAWVDLGSCFYLRGEYDEAIRHYQRAIAVDPDLAEAHFNLALTYSELYRFADSGRALARAQRVDSTRVARWLEQSPSRGAAEVGGGFERGPEIREDLRASWVLEDDSAAWSSPWRDYLSLPFALAGLVVAWLAGHVLPRAHLEAQAPPLVDWGSRWGSVYRVLAPGLAELEAGESAQAAIALLVAAGLLLIPWVEANGYRLPWGFEPVVHLGWWAAMAGLALFFALRWRREALY